MMRFVLMLLLFPLSLGAQEIMLNGRVFSELQKPINSATITFKDIQTKQPLTSAVSNNDGTFKATFKAHDSLILEVSHLSFENYTEVLSPNSIDSLLIQLYAKGNQLEEVSVIGKKPLITRKIDRLVFNVENSNITSLNSWEILKKTPLVSVHGSTISVRGNSNVKILINEKPVMLSGEELKALLESNNGTDIESIEVITNPPAKYEASGSSVINIKMKKTNLYGYKGVLTARHTQSDFAKELIGISNFFRSEKWNIKATYNFISGTYARYGTDFIFYPKDETEWKTELNRVDHAKKQNSYSIGADYSIDSTLTLSVGLDGYYDPKTYGYYNVPTSISNNSGTAISRYQTLNDHIRTNKNNNFYTQLSKVWSENKKLDWTNYASFSNSTHWQDIQTRLNFLNEPKDTSHFSTDNINKIQMYASQLDLSNSWKGVGLEYGAKYSFVKTQSDLQFQEMGNGTMQHIPEKSNLFNYKEHNISAYASGSYSYKRWQWKVGLRAEQTLLNGAVEPSLDINKQNYLEFFPTFYMQYNLEKAGQIGFSYGKRISRPSYTWLNPAKSFYNLFSYFQGDPRLRATLGHNLSLNYTIKNWNIDLFYQYEKWPNMEISFQNNETNELVYKYTNIRKRELGGLSINKNFLLYKSWQLQTDLTGYFHENQFIGMDQQLYFNNVFFFNSRINTSLVIDPKSKWNLEIGYNFYSPSIQGPFTISSFSSTYLTTSRKFFKERLELGLSFMDIFKDEGTTIRTRYADQNNYFLDYADARRIVGTLKYSFGNQTLKNGKSVKQAEERGRF